MLNLSVTPSNSETGPGTALSPAVTLSQRLLGGIDWLAGRLGRTPKIAPHLATGLRGEEAALFYLKSRGYTIVARRWSTPKLPGDVDLIAWEGDTLCFVEVKTRTGRNIVPAEFSVDQHKQRILRSLAMIFRKRFPEPARRQIPVRFDVVSVYLPRPGAQAKTEVELYPAAFSRYSS